MKIDYGRIEQPFINQKKIEEIIIKPFYTENMETIRFIKNDSVKTCSGIDSRRT